MGRVVTAQLEDIPAWLRLAEEVEPFTFEADNPAGEPARRFYEQMGFHAAGPAPNGPGGEVRQIFRRIV
ncbi:MAG: hypothetical protein JXA21_11195 [Anaerolineae bacterium]|nr:hypothetical protein [Anaerolineae bacterium]